MATIDTLSPPTPTITQPIQVGQINASFPVDQEQSFEVWLASHVKPDDLLIIISNPVIGQIDHQIDWLHCSANKESATAHGNKNSKNTQQTSEPSKCRVSFFAQIVGLYTINVEITQPQKFCVQFQAKAYDLGKVFIQNSTGKCRFNESYEFGVDASEAGEGQLEIAVNEGEIPNQVQVLDNGKCIVNFVPEENIPHVVDIKFNGHNVNGCPFVVEIEQQNTGISVDDVPKQRLNNDVPTKLGKPILKSEDRILVNTRAVFSLLNVRLSRADVEDIIVVDPENQTINYKLSQDDQGRFDFEFTPAVVGDYTVDIQSDSALLKMLPSSITEQFPFSIKVFDFNEVSVSDVTDGVVGHPIYFFIDATKAGSGNLEIKISSTTRNVPNYPSSEANAKIRVNFTPIEAVDHTIDVKFNGIPVPNNPFIVKVAQLPQARLPITSQDALKYTPVDELIRFAVEYIGPKSNLPSLTAESCQVYVLEPDFVYRKLNTGELLSTEKNQSTKQQQQQHSFRVEFKPSKIGPHKLFVIVNNELVPGSPITSNVYNIKEVRVSFEKLNEPLSQIEAIDSASKPLGKVNEPVTFTVDASRAGEGTLALAVVSSISKNPVQTDVKVSDKGHGLYNLTFIPTEFAPHSIDMSFNDRLVPMSPFIVDMIDDKGQLASEVLANEREDKKAQVSRLSGAAQTKTQKDRDLASDLGNLSLKSKEEANTRDSNANQNVANSSVLSREDEILRSIVVHGVGLKRTSVNSTGAFIIETNRMAQARDFDVLISDPSNNLVDVQCYLQQDGNLLTEWAPRRVGPHKIEVLYRDRPVPNSPFTTQAFDPSSVLLNLPKISEFNIDERVEFKIDRRDAGEAALEVVITNSAGEEQPVDISPLEDSKAGEIVTFKPSMGGKYKLSVTYSGYEVAKSPFSFIVHDNREPLKVTGNGLKFAEVNRSAHFSVEAGADGELKLRIECGDREIVPKIERKGRAYLVKYKPSETGFAIISLYWNGVHINGSPYSVPVNDLSKIVFINPSSSGKSTGSSEHLNQISVDYEPRIAREITVDTSKCGPGHLKAESYCRANPSLKFSIPVIQLSTDRYKLVFTCPPEHEQLSKGVNMRDISLEATYLLRFYYNNILVPEAHASVILSPHGSNKLKDTAKNRTTNNTGDIIKTTNNNNSNGISSKSKQTQPTAKPLVSGDIETKTEDNASPSCDPEKVVCTADSLKGGILGEEIKTFIDTRKAGPGELTALCTGPQKVAFCELLDRGDGTFILYIKPQESGRHFLTVKYAEQHIPKSPFLIKVSGRPDPSKVRVYGPGVEHGVLSLYQSRFVCDTRGAGAGQLTVRIRGPKGAFRMETQRENQRDRTILCKYDPTEPGDYRIEIKWSGRQVPGSPFSVMIFDTQEELNRYLLSQQQRDRMHRNEPYLSGKLSADKLALPHQVPFQQITSDYGHYSHNPTLTTPTAAQKVHHQQASSRLK